MKKIVKTLSAFALSCTVLMGSCGGGEKRKEKEEMKFYENPYRIGVSTDGSSVTGAAKTVSDVYAALEEVKKAQGDTSVTSAYDALVVTFQDGTYAMDKTLEITHEYTNGLPIVFEGNGADKVTLDGGKSFSGGWETHDAAKGIYKRKLENVTIFRQLYVDDRLGIRARYPNDTGSLDYDYVPLFWDDENRKVGVPNYAAEDVGLANIKDCELHFVQEWTQSVGHISDVDPVLGDENTYFDFEESWFTATLFTRAAPIRNSGHNRCWFENSLALLDAENEWYYDETESTLYYKPASGVDVNAMTFTVPQTESLVKITGDRANRPKNVSFVGLTFANTNWNYASENCYCDNQAGLFYTADPDTVPGKAPACFYTNFSDNIRLYRCTVKNTGAYGVDFNVGTKNSSVIECTVEKCATSGINVGFFGETTGLASLTGGGYVPAGEEEITEYITLKNNVVRQIGTSFKGGSTGIVAGYTRYFDVIHNDISDVSYSGVAVGWGWEWEDVINQNVNISYNKITNVMNHLPFDGAPIYLLGKQVASLEGSTIIGNYIEVENGLGGIYFDNSSSNYTLKDNVIKGTGRLGVIDLHDWNYLLRNISITNTYVSTNDKIFVHAYAQNTTSKNWENFYKGQTPPTLMSRGIFYDEAVKAYSNGKWNKNASEIIKNAGVEK